MWQGAQLFYCHTWRALPVSWARALPCASRAARRMACAAGFDSPLLQVCGVRVCRAVGDGGSCLPPAELCRLPTLYPSPCDVPCAPPVMRLSHGRLSRSSSALLASPAVRRRDDLTGPIRWFFFSFPRDQGTLSWLHISQHRL